MSATNPEVYYSDPSLHGNYRYEILFNLVNNFMDNYVGDNSLLGQIPRSRVIYWMKKGIQQFNSGALNEIRGCELELNDTLTAIYPPDYFNFVRISFVNPVTGELMPLVINPKLNTYPAYLQDQNANILTDQDGYILEGTTLNQLLIDNPNNAEITQYNINPNCFCDYDGWTNWRLDTSKNLNGQYNLMPNGIHFSSDCLSKVIMLEYISDGLESLDENNIRINKLAEISLYNWCKWNILSNTYNAQEYVVNRAKKEYDTAYRNAKIKLDNIRPNDIMNLINSRNVWVK